MSKRNRTTTPAAPAATPAAPVATPAAAPAPTTNALLAQAYGLGKAYNVRPNTAQDNALSWQLLTQCIQSNGGSATRQQLEQAVADRNHKPMVGYAIRRGWLAPVAPTTPAPSAQ